MQSHLVRIISVLLAIIIPLTSAAGSITGPDQGPKGGAKCSVFLNGSLLNPSPADPETPCYFGHDTANGVECARARKAGEFNYYTCQCISQQSAQDSWNRLKTILMAIGGSLLGLGLLNLVLLKFRWQKATACLGERVNKAPCFWKWFAIFWAILLIPIGLVISGIVCLGVGGAIDTNAYWRGCG